MILLLACAVGPQETTRIDDLQVVAVLAEPPSAAPGELINLETLVADPLQTGFEQWQWTCVGEVCDPVGDALLVQQPVPTQHWTLVCEPGLCDNPEVRSDAGALLEELPRQGVSLGLRWLQLAPLGHANPTITCEGDTALSCLIEGDFSEYSAVHPYSTSGGFEEELVEVGPGDTEVSLTWFPDEEEAEAWVVLVDGQGGVGVWVSER